MKYLCLAYYHEQAFDALPADRKTALVSRCPPLDAALRASGGLVAVASLGASADARSIRPRNGKPLVTDGPYAETKEQLGSFFILEADDWDHAVRLASMHPAAQLGEQVGWGIEVRPIEFFDAPALGPAPARNPRCAA